MKAIIELLVNLSRKQNTTLYKVCSIIMGGTFFLIILPLTFVQLGLLLEDHLSVFWSPLPSVIIAATTISVGLSLLFWTTMTQWVVGRGTPAPNAPTQKLIVVGPYRYCRNPIELGAVLYYLGVGTYFVTLTTGIVCCVLGLIVGSLYHKFIEEKELERRFGDEYIAYKKSTPFLVPRIRDIF